MLLCIEDDFQALCTEAALNAVQRRYPQIYKSNERLVLDPTSINVELRDFMISVRSTYLIVVVFNNGIDLRTCRAHTIVRSCHGIGCVTTSGSTGRSTQPVCGKCQDPH